MEENLSTGVYWSCLNLGNAARNFLSLLCVFPSYAEWWPIAKPMPAFLSITFHSTEEINSSSEPNLPYLTQYLTNITSNYHYLMISSSSTVHLLNHIRIYITQVLVYLHLKPMARPSPYLLAKIGSFQAPFHWLWQT